MRGSGAVVTVDDALDVRVDDAVEEIVLVGESVLVLVTVEVCVANPVDEAVDDCDETGEVLAVIVSVVVWELLPVDDTVVVIVVVPYAPGMRTRVPDVKHTHTHTRGG